MFGFGYRRRVRAHAESLGAVLEHVGVYEGELAVVPGVGVLAMPTAENVLRQQAEEVQHLTDMVAVRDAELAEVEKAGPVRALLADKRAIQDALGRIGVDTSIGDKPIVRCIVEAGRALERERQDWHDMLRTAEDSKAIVTRNLGYERQARSADRIAYAEALRTAGREKGELLMRLRGLEAVLIANGLAVEEPEPVAQTLRQQAEGVIASIKQPNGSFDAAEGFTLFSRTSSDGVEGDGWRWSFEGLAALGYRHNDTATLNGRRCVWEPING